VEFNNFRLRGGELQSLIPVFLALALFLGVLPCQAGDEPRLDADKVLVLMAYSNSCKKWCKEVKPRLGKVEEKYGDKVVVHMVNVSKEHFDGSMEKAKQLGIPGFLVEVRDWVPCVAVFTRDRKLIKELTGAKNLETYCKFIDKALKKG
jgi:thiol-disulfide isomerase/thioredoxin